MVLQNDSRSTTRISVRVIEMKAQWVDIKGREVNVRLLPTVKYGR